VGVEHTVSALTLDYERAFARALEELRAVVPAHMRPILRRTCARCWTDRCGTTRRSDRLASVET
jgi:hypothetical protein